MSFIFKKDLLVSSLKPLYLSHKAWRYLYQLEMNSIHRSGDKKYWSRTTTVVHSFIGDNFIVHAGKRWHPRRVTSWMVGFKLGEFTWNRRLALYKAKQRRKRAAKKAKAAKLARKEVRLKRR